jgi:hypothetical protein
MREDAPAVGGEPLGDDPADTVCRAGDESGFGCSHLLFSSCHFPPCAKRGEVSA